MADWSTPPTSDELRLAGWDKPPTPQELADAEEIQRQDQAVKDEEEAAAKAAFLERATQNETAPMGMRAWLGLKKTTAGKLNFLKEKGYKAFDIKGEIVYIDENNEPHFVEKKGIDSVKEAAGDLLDISNPVISAIPSLVVGLTMGRLKALTPIAAAAKIGGVQALADAGGALVGQGISAMVPGSDEMYPADRIADVGLNVAAGAVPVVAGLAGRKVLQAVGPETVHGAQLAKTLRGGKSVEEVGDAVQAGLDLERRTGLPKLSAGQLANTKEGLGYEESLRRGAGGSADVFPGHDVVRSSALHQKALAAVGDLTGESGANPGLALRRGVAAWNQSIKEAREDLSKRWKIDSNKLALMTGNKPVVPAEPIVAELDALLKDFPVSPSRGDSSRIHAAISAHKKRLVSANRNPNDLTWTPTLTTSQIMADMSNASAGSKGTGVAIEGLGDGEVDKAVSARLAKAYDAALTSAEDTAPPDVAATIRTMRENYRDGIGQIQMRSSELLSSVMKRDARGRGVNLGEWVSGAHDEQVYDAMKLLDESSPQDAMKLRGGLLEALINRAVSKGQQGRTATEGLVRILKDNDKKKTMATIMSNVPEKKMQKFLSEMQDVLSYGERTSSAGIASGKSPTEPLRRLGALSKNVPVLEGLSDKAREWLVKLSNPKTLAAALNEDAGRLGLLGLERARATGNVSEMARSLSQIEAVVIASGLTEQETEAPLPQKDEP